MKDKGFIKTLLGVIVVLIIVLGVLWVFLKPEELVFQGRIEAREVYLSAKITSRLKSIEVEEGSSVTKGQLLAVLESPEIDAKESQALAIKSAAEAMKQKAIRGARPEEIAAAKSVYEKAKAASEVMQKTYKRIENLYNDGLLPAQDRDEAYAKMQAALQDENAAYNQYLIATKAVRREDIAAAKANESQASGALQELEIMKGERNIISNIDGEVMEYLPEMGELIGAGMPVAHLVDLKDSHVVLNVKETNLIYFNKDSEFTATVPALGNKEIRFKVYYISALGDYATWNATKTKGEFDVRTFEIKARPVEQNENLRPGMSILVDGSQFDK
ncbi:efflux RND transporter periplasmic adaptor subunit [Maribacter sp. MMG018]|uniref:HlyD family secretion protein n=1 Tax=Maribacter sp. MMG018 TaxID=2822688 RepID=UPI001B39832A|nr:efflux RND transporter periplasmic adaptor subunit [Maribacter sp. MMG018]MBQ4914196.1 efflux RND transporter periplasmic adaptor subunit [Maribacter sp. MMG018]